MSSRNGALLRAAQMPGRVVESVSNSVFGFLEDYLLKDQEELARERFRERPLHEIEIGRKALRASERALQDSIALAAASNLLKSRREAERASEKLEEARVFRNIGYGTMKKAVVWAATEGQSVEPGNRVPKYVVKEAVLRSINLGADPDRDGFMKPEESEQVGEVFDKFNNITVLPIRK